MSVARDLPTGPDPDDELFEHERARLVALAYRITGSATTAEDLVQEAWIRWANVERDGVARPAAWLTTVTSRLALDHLKSARHRREAYVGPWLPEAVDIEPGPSEHAELAESLSLGLLAVLERLGPTERVVFLLADVFALPFGDIAAVVDKTPEACRQVASRARRRIRDERPRFSPTDDSAWEVAGAFLAAAQGGDLDHPARSAWPTMPCSSVTVAPSTMPPAARSSVLASRGSWPTWPSARLREPR